MTTLTIKFGGTSVGSARAIRDASAIVLEQWRAGTRVAVVVSALSGVTDALIQGATRAAAGDDSGYAQVLEQLGKRHQVVIADLFGDSARRHDLEQTVDCYLHDYGRFCESVQVLGELSARALDTISCLGERISARLVAAFLAENGASSEALDASSLIVTDDRFGQASPLMDATCQQVSERLAPLLAKGTIAVVAGFFGATASGVTTTLGRGGSDFTASILGHCLDADEIWIMTDVNGVMTADPRLVPEARTIPHLTYSEVAELAYFGAKVLHPRTIRPAVDKGIPLWVKNSADPHGPATLVGPLAMPANGAVKAVTAIQGLSMITVEGRGMLGVPGIAARTFAAVASQDASVLMISQASSEQSICLVVRQETAARVVPALEEALSREIARRDIDRVSSLAPVVIVTAVGAGMRSTPGVAARIFGALAEASINIIAVAQGSSECSVSFVVGAAEAVSAVESIHRKVIVHA